MEKKTMNIPQGNHLSYLTQPEITIKIPFELIDIDYDWIKYEVASMECV